VNVILFSNFFQIPQKINNQKVAMDYNFEKRFLLLLNEVGTRGIIFIYFLKRGNVEMIYHFFPYLFHFFLSIFKRFKDPVNQDQGNLFNFKRLFVNHP
jgi:hypothetical protein